MLSIKENFAVEFSKAGVNAVESWANFSTVFVIIAGGEQRGAFLFPSTRVSLSLLDFLVQKVFFDVLKIAAELAYILGRKNIACVAECGMGFKFRVAVADVWALVTEFVEICD